MVVVAGVVEVVVEVAGEVVVVSAGFSIGLNRLQRSRVP